MTEIREMIIYPTETIGAWAHADATVDEVTRRPDFWEYAGISCGELVSLMAGGMDPSYALAAVIAPEGDTVLADGCHRYSVARDLGILFLPVKMGTWDEWFGEDACREPNDAERTGETDHG